MDRLRRFRNSLRLFLASVSSGVTVVALGFVSQRLENSAAAAMVTISLVSVVAFFLGKLVDWLVNSSPRVRRYLLGEDFIEGWWWDLARPSSDSVPTHGVLQRIWFDGDAFHVDGSSFRPDGTKLAAWSSTACTYSRRTLYVVYEAQTELLLGGYERGVVQLLFDRPANSYSGFLVDFSGAVVRRLRGQRVPAAAIRKHKQFSALDEKSSFIREKLVAGGATALRAGSNDGN